MGPDQPNSSPQPPENQAQGLSPNLQDFFKPQGTPPPAESAAPPSTEGAPGSVVSPGSGEATPQGEPVTQQAAPAKETTPGGTPDPLNMQEGDWGKIQPGVTNAAESSTAAAPASTPETSATPAPTEVTAGGGTPTPTPDMTAAPSGMDSAPPLIPPAPAEQAAPPVEAPVAAPPTETSPVGVPSENPAASQPVETVDQQNNTPAASPEEPSPEAKPGSFVALLKNERTDLDNAFKVAERLDQLNEWKTAPDGAAKIIQFAKEHPDFLEDKAA